MTDESRSAAPLTTPFGFESTADEVVEGIDLTGKKAIVTGGASGIGVATARALASAGASVTLAVRRTGEGEKVAADIRASTGNDAVAGGRPPQSSSPPLRGWRGSAGATSRTATRLP
ncbi:MAG: SDR family NAD(P)-dependent oxidoreductase [Pseudonocardiaceae bacterium]